MPVHMDVYISDCDRQDFVQFAGQHVWTVQMKVWFGPSGSYPHLGDEQFDLKFDIPADWASNGWEVPMSSAIYSTDPCMPWKKKQALKALDMNGNPMKSGPWLIKQAIKHGILTIEETSEILPQRAVLMLT